MIIVDEKNRVIVKINDKGDTVLGRYPDLTPEFKDMVADLFSEVTGNDREKVRKFLDFQDEEEKFCS